jgi:hypothetical protein
MPGTTRKANTSTLSELCKKTKKHKKQNPATRKKYTKKIPNGSRRPYGSLKRQQHQQHK